MWRRDTSSIRQFKIISSTRLGNGHIVLPGQNQSNLSVRIEASPDLVTAFATMGRATAASIGAFQFEDVNAGSFPKRFYRLAFP